jgi:hypothetical protein
MRPFKGQESDGRGGGDSGLGRTSGTDGARSDGTDAVEFGSPIEMPAGTTAISVVRRVSGSDGQLHARRAPSAGALSWCEWSECFGASGAVAAPCEVCMKQSGAGTPPWVWGRSRHIPIAPRADTPT